MAIKVKVDGIWREFDEIRDVLSYVLGECLFCRKKCQGMFCRAHYRQLTPELRQHFIAKYRGRIVGSDDAEDDGSTHIEMPPI